jgi:hypothetical protein
MKRIFYKEYIGHYERDDIYPYSIVLELVARYEECEKYEYSCIDTDKWEELSFCIGLVILGSRGWLLGIEYEREKLGYAIEYNESNEILEGNILEYEDNEYYSDYRSGNHVEEREKSDEAFFEWRRSRWHRRLIREK